MNTNFSKNDLIDILIKKASGYYYTEEQFEYEKTQKKSNLNQNLYSNVSFFDNNDRGLTNNNNTNDMINISNENGNSRQNNQELTLIKKKIATHYISPDIHAIKILFEIFEKKVGDDNLENLTDDELINLKNTILKELSDEITENK